MLTKYSLLHIFSQNNDSNSFLPYKALGYNPETLPVIESLVGILNQLNGLESSSMIVEVLEGVKTDLCEYVSDLHEHYTTTF